MSGIIGSKLNIRGSGRIAKLGTDGQVLTSAGAGVSAVYEDASGGGTSWQSVVTASTLNAVAGNGYPINTTSNACTVTLPGSASVGDTIEFTDYARNFATNALTIDQNSLNYQGATSPNPVYNTSGSSTGESIRIVYVDATKGWVPLYDGARTYSAEWLCIAGGGGSCGAYAGGGGAGGYRNSYASEDSGGGASTESVATLTQGDVYTIVIGAGGAAGVYSPATPGGDGGDSTITGTGVSITSTGGGGGGNNNTANAGDGGSGGGGGSGTTTGGSGTANQGYDGGDSSGASGWGGCGGGGASAQGVDRSGNTDAGSNGGAGLDSDITASTVGRGGGGGGGCSPYGTIGSASDGGGSDAAGTANTGGGGSASDGATPVYAGGSGVIILRIPDAYYSGTTTGSPTIDTSSVADETILIFNSSGSYTA
jgi:hypothetical protein